MDAKLVELGIIKPTFGRMVAFVDFGNVNHWFEHDERDWEDNPLPEGSKLIIDIEKLGTFIETFCAKKRFYYGLHPKQKGSLHLIIKAQNCGFKKITKPMQFVRHYLDQDELTAAGDTTLFNRDTKGIFIKIPKSNFDVEIAVDAIRLLEDYDTFVLFSGDADFANLAKYLKRKGKKVILLAAGEVFHTLKEQADLYINAQRVKAQIASIKNGRIK